uniref:Uncharacterized protein n=1 Tax=Arundo donax TaxID=35708 RepID=A0A0A9EH55_ARUDO
MFFTSQYMTRGGCWAGPG